jgi:hypothetical protein
MQLALRKKSKKQFCNALPLNYVFIYLGLEICRCRHRTLREPLVVSVAIIMKCGGCDVIFRAARKCLQRNYLI